MFIDPSWLDVDTGDSATLNVAIEGASNMGSYSFAIQWDPAVISFASVSNGTMLGSTGRVVVCPAPTVTASSLAFSCSTLGATPGPSGDGVLATLTFGTVSEGVSFIDFASAGVDNILGFPSTVTTNDGQVAVKPPATPTPTEVPTSTPTITPTSTPLVTPTSTPVLIALQADADTYLDSEKPTDNYGSDDKILVDGNSGKIRRVIVHFDLSGISSGANVTSATLRMCKIGGAANRTHVLKVVTSAWGEASVTWNTQPAVAASASASYVVPSADGCVTRPVTADVQTWVNGSANFGWRISDQDETSGGSKVDYGSRETSNANEVPLLTIVYIVP